MATTEGVGTITVDVDSDRAIITPGIELAMGTAYYVEIEEDAFRSATTLLPNLELLDKSEWNFTTIDWYHFAGALPTPTIGTGDGEFDHPRGMAIDSQGSLWIADRDNARIQKFDGTSWSSFGTYSATPTNPGEFANIIGVAFDEYGDLWATDSPGCQVQRYDIEEEEWHIMGDSLDGLNGPQYIDFDSNGNAWVTNWSGSNVLMWDKDSGIWEEVVGTGENAGEVTTPVGIYIDQGEDGDIVWIADRFLNEIQRYDVEEDTWTE